MAQKMNVQYIRLYTDGSAARKLAPEAPEKRAAVLPKVHKRSRVVIRLDPVATLGIAVALCMLIMMAVGIVQLSAAQAELTAMEGYVEQLAQENIALSGEYQAGYDLSKIRQTALALDMIPAEQATRVMIQLPADPAQQVQVSLWERIGTFLTGLFA